MSRALLLGLAIVGTASASAEARQLTPAQASLLMTQIQAVNRCRIAEAKKIDDGISQVEVISQKLASACPREISSLRASLQGTPMAASAADLNDPSTLADAVRQERSPESNILSPR